MERSQDVSTVADARASLSKHLAVFRASPETAEPVVIGSHRKPEAVLVPYPRFVDRDGGLVAGDAARVLDLLRQRLPLIKRLAAFSHIDGVAVFGSVARGEETESSDIDLLVDVDPSATLFDLSQFEIDMEAVFERPVGVVSRAALDVRRDADLLAGALAL